MSVGLSKKRAHFAYWEKAVQSAYDLLCDQKVLSLIHFKAFHKTKSLFSLSFYLIESHLDSVTLDCFCTTILKEDSASNLQNGES